jgi:hypothetical protein
MSIRLRSAAAVALLATASAAHAAERDWGRTLTEDAQAFHDAIAATHPGPLDAENPGFKALLEDGLRQARARAETARDFGAYWWAMREYVARFDDGHVQIGMAKEAPDLPYAWAGVLTRFEGDRQVVIDRLDEPTAPPLGAELVSCDGAPAAKLAAERVGRFQGRWMLAAQRAKLGPRVLADLGNPYAARPEGCVFRVDGRAKTFKLAWRPVATAELTARLDRAAQAYRGPIEMRRAGDAWWIALSSFNGAPGSEPAGKLAALIAELNTRQAEVRAAPRIVLDLRGNGGGSSVWSRDVAKAIWGEDFVKAHTPQGSTAVDWRVSAPAIKTLADYRDAIAAQAEHDAEVVAWLDDVVSHLKAAQAEGRPFWRQASDDAQAALPTPAASAYVGKVIVVTDPACASACLDAVDLWKALGAEQVGRETSADTPYMEVRSQALPSGLAQAGVPMKVYRGRVRGANEPQRPAVAYDGDMADTAALEKWLAGLK